jgi:hypothetical protein
MFEGESYQGDEVGETSDLRPAFDLAGFCLGEGVPEAVLGPRGVVFAEFGFQFLEHRFGEALPVGSAVEDLQGGDLGLVRLDVVAERFQEVRGLFLRGSVEPLGDDGVDGDRIYGLFGLLFHVHQQLAEDAVVEWRTGLQDELILRGVDSLLRNFGRGSAWFASGCFGNRVGVKRAQ